ncbi:MAG: radical SAM protein, partial [Candidatus Theseobacter exili]|nr:radical SAM protein [Candidatus Theseobacter exili]
MEDLVQELMSRFEEEKISISIPSSRADKYSVDIARQVQKVRKTGITIAPEAGTERLRKVINKNLRHEQIIETAKYIFACGWKVIKLYFMVGLPTETMKDIDGIIECIYDVLNASKRDGKGKPFGKVNVTISTFIPKPHTPFQWMPMMDLDRIRYVHGYLRKRICSNKIKLKFHQPDTSLLECVFSRGDRRLSKVIENSWRNGCRFDEWTECFDVNLWNKSFIDIGIDPKEYLREREQDEGFPWEIINTSVSREFLWQQRCNAYKNDELLENR